MSLGQPALEQSVYLEGLVVLSISSSRSIPIILHLLRSFVYLITAIQETQSVQLLNAYSLFNSLE